MVTSMMLQLKRIFDCYIPKKNKDLKQDIWFANQWDKFNNWGKDDAFAITEIFLGIEVTV